MVKRKERRYWVAGATALLVAAFQLPLLSKGPKGPPEGESQGARGESLEESDSVPCPAGTLPEQGVCIPAVKPPWQEKDAVNPEPSPEALVVPSASPARPDVAEDAGSVKP